jgi:4-amino-4-deoxy-L-arabinose transferase-like glycosyltransferase
MRSRVSIEIALLAGIVLAYLVVGALYALLTPAWQVPDEPAHYNNVAQVANNGCCPIIEMGDWDTNYLSELTSTQFAPEGLGRLDSIEYEDHQPPLYYLIASLIYELSNGSLSALRLLSVVIGAGIVVIAYAVGKAIFPRQFWIALAAAALVAFIPQHVSILAGVNNDSLAELVIGLILLASVLYVRGDGRVPAWLLGLLVGIGFVTKGTTYLMAGVALFAILLRWWSTDRGFVSLARNVILFLVPALLLGGLWWARNFAVYGVPDFLGLREHDRVVAGQSRTADHIALVGWSAYLGEAANTTFNSFWGQFGWMAAPLPAWAYRILQGASVLALTGLLVAAFSPKTRVEMEADENHSQVIWLLLLVILLAFAAYVYYNSEFLQLQGRYLYPALIPIALLWSKGLDRLRQVTFGRWQRLSRWGRWLTLALHLALIPLDVYLLFRLVIPALSP